MNEKPQDFLLHFWVASWQISPIIPQTERGSCSASFTITKSITFGKFTRALKLQFSWWWSMSLSSPRLSIVLYFLVATMFEKWYLFSKCIRSCTISLLKRLKSDKVIHQASLKGKNWVIYKWCKGPYIIFHLFNKARCKSGLWLSLRQQILFSQVIRHTYKNNQFLSMQQTYFNHILWPALQHGYQSWITAWSRWP